jgi:hypothetical protein
MTASQPTPIFKHLPHDDPRIDTLLEAFRRSHVNGGALLAQFSVRYDGAGKWYTRRDSEGREQHDFSALLASQTVAEVLSDLQLRRDSVPDPQWERTSSFVLDGELTNTLLFGGAYDRFKGPPKQAKRIAEAFCDALLGDRYWDVDAVQTGKAWSPWFLEVAWDISWLILDHGQSRVWLLCVTDED